MHELLYLLHVSRYGQKVRDTARIFEMRGQISRYDVQQFVYFMQQLQQVMQHLFELLYIWCFLHFLDEVIPKQFCFGYH